MCTTKYIQMAPNDYMSFAIKSMYPSIPLSDSEATDDPKVDDMQHGTNVKQIESIETMQVGRISIHYTSPKKNIAKNCDGQDCVSATSKSWFSIVEEEDVVGTTITPTQAWQEPIHQDVVLAEQQMHGSESVETTRFPLCGRMPW
jgi:hypothetical protein